MNTSKKEPKIQSVCTICGITYLAKIKRSMYCSQACCGVAHERRQKENREKAEELKNRNLSQKMAEELDRKQLELNRRIDAKYLWKATPAVSLRIYDNVKFQFLKEQYERRYN